MKDRYIIAGFIVITFLFFAAFPYIAGGIQNYVSWAEAQFRSITNTERCR